ncbi:hypothetical protein A2U01_0064549, partial [Trifolium medium]|nr:hypothetical protein [Trifolium medium]
PEGRKSIDKIEKLKNYKCRKADALRPPAAWCYDRSAKSEKGNFVLKLERPPIMQGNGHSKLTA